MLSGHCSQSSPAECTNSMPRAIIDSHCSQIGHLTMNSEVRALTTVTQCPNRREHIKPSIRACLKGKIVNTAGPEPRTQALTLVLLRFTNLPGRLREILLRNKLPGRQLSGAQGDDDLIMGTDRSSRIANMPASVTTFRRSAPLKPSESYQDTGVRHG